MKPEPREISPRKALAEVAAAVPADIHQNIIIIGSLAARESKLTRASQVKQGMIQELLTKKTRPV